MIIVWSAAAPSVNKTTCVRSSPFWQVIDLAVSESAISTDSTDQPLWVSDFFIASVAAASEDLLDINVPVTAPVFDTRRAISLAPSNVGNGRSTELPLPPSEPLGRISIRESPWPVDDHAARATASRSTPPTFC